MEMKEKCDNNCATCPVQGQIYCTLAFARASNVAIKTLDERVTIMEQYLAKLSEPREFINPLNGEEVTNHLA